jgi:hypothetical protein
MIRKSGNRFSSGQTQSVCPEIMLKQELPLQEIALIA